jgi:hypothetical protein
MFVASNRCILVSLPAANQVDRQAICLTEYGVHCLLLSHASAAALTTVLRKITLSYMDTCHFQVPAQPKYLNRSM